MAATLTTAGGLSWAGLVWAGLDRAGSGRYALILTLFLLACAALGLAAAQVGASSRGAYALAVGALVLTYLVRGVIDGQSLDGAWLTPMGWLAEVRPDGDWQLWPFALMAALSVALLAGAVAVRTDRDLGGGLLAARSGPATASPRLASPVALTWRTGRGALAAWLMGSMVWGVAFGLLTRDVQQIVSSNPDLATMVGAGKGSVVDGVVSLSAATVALMAAALGIQIVGRAAAEEGQGRLALVLSTRVGRLRWWAGLAAVVSTQAALVLAAGGAAIGVGVWTSLGDSGYVPRGVWSTLAYFPAVLLVGAITAAAYAGGPRIAALGLGRRGLGQRRGHARGHIASAGLGARPLPARTHPDESPWSLRTPQPSPCSRSWLSSRPPRPASASPDATSPPADAPRSADTYGVGALALMGSEC